MALKTFRDYIPVGEKEQYDMLLKNNNVRQSQFISVHSMVNLVVVLYVNKKLIIILSVLDSL